MNNTKPRRCKSKLFLTDEEAARLNLTLNQFHLPRSIIILEAIQAGLHGRELDTVPARRNRTVYYRIPPETRQQVKQLALQHAVTQQTLIRHMLSTYLSHLTQQTHPTPKTPPTKHRKGGRGR